MKWLKEVFWFLKALFTRGKPRLETEIEMVQLLALRGEMGANDFYDHFNEHFDFDNPKPGLYVSFGLIYSIMIELEDQGVVSSRMVKRDEFSDKRRMVWRLTGRGPRKKSNFACPSFQPAFGGT